MTRPHAESGNHAVAVSNESDCSLMWSVAPLLFILHSAGMLVDEIHFHRRRGLPRWERWGHPADTLTVLVCYVLALALPPTPRNLHVYIAAAAFSTLFVTKDEWVHARRCTGGEMWLHSVLFVLHPVLLGLLGAFWIALRNGGNAFSGIARADFRGLYDGSGLFAAFFIGQTMLTGLFLGYQLLYWNGPWKQPLPQES